MYFYGENTPRPREAWRPEVHDSDGLLVRDDAGRWTWQPLLNPSRITNQEFRGSTYGLMQRDDHFGSYEDAEANYDRRPSALVTLAKALNPAEFAGAVTDKERVHGQHRRVLVAGGRGGRRDQLDLNIG